jgi:hypothetical protein
MPDLTDLPALDVAIGLAFMYFLLSVVCSSVQEVISSVLKLRARNLEAGIRSLIADKTKADAFYKNWRIDALKTPRWIRGSKKPRKPSYIPSRTFALALIDTVAPTPGSRDDNNVLRTAGEAIKEMPDGTVGKQLLLDALDKSEERLNVFRGEIEDAFNATMDRATGWYKRKVQIILFAIAVIVAGSLNADTFNVAQRLFQDDALRAQVVGQAVKAAEENEPTPADQVTAKTVEEQIKQARATALPFGWSAENIPDEANPEGKWGSWNWLPAWLLKVGGILVTAFALMLGAPFWFDVLGRFAKLRSSGNRIGTPKDDETAPVDRDERLKAGTSAGATPPPPIADAEREKNATAEEKRLRQENERKRASRVTAAEPNELQITVAAAPRRGLFGGS